MKRLLLSIVTMLAVVSMNAQNKLYIEVGSSTTAAKIPVSIFMTNEVAMAGLQASYELPEGLTKDNFIFDDDEEQYVELNRDRCAKAFVNAKVEMFAASKPNDLLISLTAGTSGKTIDAGEGLIGTFYIDASSLGDGTYSVKQYTASVFPDANTRYDMDDMTSSFTISNGAVSGINNITVSGKTNGIYNIAGQQMNGLQKGINIVDGAKVYVK